MKKTVITIMSIIVLATMAMGLTSCLNRQSYTLNLPAYNSVEKIVLEQGDKSKSIEDVDDIKDIMGVITSVKRTTNKESIQDSPTDAENEIKVDIYYDEGKCSTIFIYTKKSDYYIEQPYNGIYQISPDEYNSVERYLR